MEKWEITRHEKKAKRIFFFGTEKLFYLMAITNVTFWRPNYMRKKTYKEKKQEKQVPQGTGKHPYDQGEDWDR